MIKEGKTKGTERYSKEIVNKSKLRLKMKSLGEHVGANFNQVANGDNTNI